MNASMACKGSTCLVGLESVSWSALRVNINYTIYNLFHTLVFILHIISHFKSQLDNISQSKSKQPYYTSSFTLLFMRYACISRKLISFTFEPKLSTKEDTDNASEDSAFLWSPEKRLSTN